MPKINPKAASLAALVALPLSFAAPAAEADSVSSLNCVGARGSASCVAVRRGEITNPHIRAVPQPVSEEERARAEARDKRWVERCRPIIRQDEFGVPRYTYAARGCESGRLD